MRKTAVLAMLLAACGVATADDGRGPIEPVSGSRLKVRHWTGADGSRLPVGLYDSELGVDCEPRLASDGKMRCLPVGLPSLEEIKRDTDVWADEAQTKPAWDTEGELGFYWIPTEGWLSRPLGCEAKKSPPLVEQEADNACGLSIHEVVTTTEAHASWGPIDPAGIVTVGAELPPTHFVELIPSM